MRQGAGRGRVGRVGRVGPAVAAVGLALMATATEPVTSTGAVSAQQAADVRGDTAGWNSGRVLDLVARARDRRREPMVDSMLRSYRADASGHVYFFLDREDEGEPVLLRADQVALDLYWARPNRTKQVIRGMRSEEQFPIKDFRYYLDRYTVIQNGFGDEIRVGEGRDVANVPHPLAPGAETVYDFRLADSMTIRLPGAAPLRVYEVQVRPEDFGDRAIVGSLFLERARADLVRLAFTFTPSAYLDRRNERVEVTLENALWEGKYWLPREQRLLVRREIPELDLDVGTVIRAVLRVRDYELNAEIPPRLFLGREVVLATGLDALAEYPFDEGLLDGLDDVGLTPGAELGTLDAVDVDEIAGRILRERFLRGVPRLRFYAPNVSAIVRYDRAEGLVTGAGLAYGVGGYQLTGYGAWAWGAKMPIAEVAARPLGGSGRGWSFAAFMNRPVDLGVRPAAAGVVASAAAAFLGEDYRDLYLTSGAAVTRELLDRGGLSLALRLSGESQRATVQAETHAPFDDDDLFRPVPAIDEGLRLGLAALGRVEGEGPFGGRADTRVALEAGVFSTGSVELTDVSSGVPADGPFATVRVDGTRTWRGDDLGWGVDTRQALRLSFSGPPQHRVLLGGRNTLPGHDFRAFSARHLALADGEAWLDVLPRLLRLRALAGAAWMDQGSGGEVVGSVGVGLGFVDGLLRLDYAVGLRPNAGPRSAWILSLDPRLWGFL